MENEQLILETPIKNPNLPPSSEPMLIIALILMLASPFTQNLALVAIALIFMFVAIYFSIQNKKTKNATMRVTSLGEHDHKIVLTGEQLDFELKGKIMYEAWRKPTESKRGNYISNVPHLSIFIPDQEQLLIQSINYSNDELNRTRQWGTLRGASAYPIGILLQMEVPDLEEIKKALDTSNIPEATIQK